LRRKVTSNTRSYRIPTCTTPTTAPHTFIAVPHRSPHRRRGFHSESAESAMPDRSVQRLSLQLTVEGANLETNPALEGRASDEGLRRQS
jgi:hypothetical protein